MARSYQDARLDIERTVYGPSVVPFPVPSAPELIQPTAPAPSPSLADDGFVRKLKDMIVQRRLRDDHFPIGIFADPAWDIFLELALAEHEQRRFSISSLCSASRVPASTALRWIKHMTEDGWLVREDDHLDARRVFIGLSREASAKMKAYVASLN